MRTTYPRSPPINLAEHPDDTIYATLGLLDAALLNQLPMIALHSSQHTMATRSNEAGAPPWVTPASCVQCSRDQCPGQVRIDVSAATE